MKKTILLAFVSGIVSLQPLFAQDISTVELNAEPLALNPAFTGSFDGIVRINTFYNTLWTGEYMPYVSHGISADSRIITDKKGNYIAAGLHFRKAEGGNLSDFNGLVSIAYHKLFTGGKNRHKTSDLAIGLQAGYIQSFIGERNLFLNPQPPQVHPGISNSINYYAVNVGVSFAHSFSEGFSFMTGISAYNLNQLVDEIERRQNSQNGYDKHYIGSAAFNIAVSKRLSLKPGAYWRTMPALGGWWVAGNDFYYAIGKYANVHSGRSLFLGLWSRNNEILTATAGAELNRFRIGASYGYYISAINTTKNGNGGLCVSLRYIAPGHKRKTEVPHIKG